MFMYTHMYEYDIACLILWNYVQSTVSLQFVYMSRPPADNLNHVYRGCGPEVS